MLITIDQMQIEVADGEVRIDGAGALKVAGGGLVIRPAGDVKADAPAKGTAKKKPAVKQQKRLSPTGKDKSDVATLEAIRKAGGCTASELGRMLGITEPGAALRLKKLKSNSMVEATGVRPKVWKLTGKGLDSLPGVEEPIDFDAP